MLVSYNPPAHHQELGNQIGEAEDWGAIWPAWLHSNYKSPDLVVSHLG